MVQLVCTAFLPRDVVHCADYVVDRCLSVCLSVTRHKTVIFVACRRTLTNNNKRQFVRRRNMSVDITRAPYRQSGNVVRDSSTETRL